MFESQQSTKSVIVVGLFKACGWLITRIFCSSQDMNPFHDKLSMSKALCFTVYSQPEVNNLVFIPLKILAKILASAYNFAVNIVMLTNITNNKTHNIYDLV